MKNVDRLKLVISVFILVVCTGVVGYSIIGDVDLADALYMTIITVTTVGYNETIELDEFGRIFTMFIIITGFMSLSLMVVIIAGMVVEGEIKNLIGRQTVDKKTRKLREHFIICGFGRIGQAIARDLSARNVEFVCIEHEVEAVRQGDELEYNMVLGDATDDETLIKAGIERARGLISATGDDAKNVYVTLSARQINPTIYIVARGNEKTTEDKLRRAGADRVVLPYLTGAHQMAHGAIYPHAIDLIDFASRDLQLDYILQEVHVLTTSPLVNHTLAELQLARKLSVIIVGIKRKDDMIFNPKADETILAGDILIAIGQSDRMSELKNLSTARMKESIL